MSRSTLPYVAPDKLEGKLLWQFCRGSRPASVIPALLQSHPSSLDEAVGQTEELRAIERCV